MRRTKIWYNLDRQSDLNKKYLCQIFNDDGEFVKLVVADSYKEAKQMVDEVFGRNKKTAEKKLYPFNMARYGHNIELAYNHQWIICREMEDGERDWDKKAFEHMQKLEEAYSYAIGNSIAWVDGRTYGILKEASAWAECYRDRRNK